MKLAIRGTGNEEKGSIDLPKQFSEPIRADLIQRAFLVVRSHDRQPYGAQPKAGMRQNAKLSRRRRDYKTAYGMGMSRAPRKTLSRNGMRMTWVGAVAPGTVGGRRSHPPKSSRIWDQKINIKERRKAIRSALAASIDKAVVAERGHRVPKDYPFALDDSFEKITKTNSFAAALAKLGLQEELERQSIIKVRAGQGKMRGRKHKGRRGILVVVSGACPLLKCGLKGLDIIHVNNLNAYDLAPGGEPGRLTLYTKKALETIKEKELFI